MPNACTRFEPGIRFERVVSAAPQLQVRGIAGAPIGKRNHVVELQKAALGVQEYNRDRHASGCNEETPMRAWLLRGFPYVALTFAVAGDPARALAQVRNPQPLAVAVEPVIATGIEALLATPNLVLVVDYYRLDMRVGPNLRIDALVVEALNSRRRVKGLRVQVFDPENRRRQDGTSYIDIEEVITLSRGLTSMQELAGKWNYDDRQATELSVTTAGGFRLAIRQSARVPRAFLSTGLLDPVVTSMDLGDLPTLKQAFDQALAILNSK
jgi:hypothetical protein